MNMHFQVILWLTIKCWSELFVWSYWKMFIITLASNYSRPVRAGPDWPSWFHVACGITFSDTCRCFCHYVKIFEPENRSYWISQNFSFSNYKQLVKIPNSLGCYRSMSVQSYEGCPMTPSLQGLKRDERLLVPISVLWLYNALNMVSFLFFTYL